MHDYVNETKILEHSDVDKIKLGSAIVPTYPTEDDDGNEIDTYLTGTVVKVCTDSRLKVIAVDVKGELAILYFNPTGGGCFKNLCSNYAREDFINGYVFACEVEMKHETEANEWIKLVKSYKKMFEGYYGDWS